VPAFSFLNARHCQTRVHGYWYGLMYMRL
jgi:hypothetical protein